MELADLYFKPRSAKFEILQRLIYKDLKSIFVTTNFYYKCPKSVLVHVWTRVFTQELDVMLLSRRSPQPPTNKMLLYHIFFLRHKVSRGMTEPN